MPLKSSLVAAALVSCACAGAAMADEWVQFQSPTGNIHCAIYVTEIGSEARCDLQDLTQSYKKQPEECELDWGAAFGVSDTGKGYVICAGDTVVDPTARKLSYGSAVSLGGISCVSAMTGMTCTNGAGHGFSAAKAMQRVY